MGLSWIALRLIIFPTKVLYSVIYETYLCINRRHDNIPGIFYDDWRIGYKAYQFFFTILIGMLVVLHTVWFLMFLKMLYCFVNTAEMHDFSVHKNGEQQEKERNKTTDLEKKSSTYTKCKHTSVSILI